MKNNHPLSLGRYIRATLVVIALLGLAWAARYDLGTIWQMQPVKKLFPTISRCVTPVEVGHLQYSRLRQPYRRIFPGSGYQWS